MPNATLWARAADPRRRVGHAIEFHPSIGSTNDRARLTLTEPRGEGRAIVADRQTSGRGRHGRRWLSPPATNLLVSVALRPALSAADGWQLGAAAALAACTAVEPEIGLFVKWPNDLYTADGLKVGGILVETTLVTDRITEAVIGLGLNVNWRRSEMPPDVAARATSLSDTLGRPLQRDRLLAKYLSALDAEIEKLERGISPLHRLRERSWLDARTVRVDAGDEVIEGRAAGIADDGSLLIATATGPRTIAFGDVVHVELPAEATA